jgi:hypothetical protein
MSALYLREDWSFLRDPSRRHDAWDAIKFVPLRADETWYLTLGGERRPFYERYDHYNWGAGPRTGPASTSSAS